MSVRRRRRRRSRRLRFTREGKYFVALTLGIGFAAINTGNNLLYLVLGMMLTLIIGSGVLSELTLRSLSVTRHLPPRLYAGDPVLIGIGLRNDKQHFASFSIEIEDMIDDHLLGKKCYFLKVPPGRTQHTSYRHRFGRRGAYRLSAFCVSTKFPFALFRKSRAVDVEEELLIYPAVHPVSPPPGRSPGRGERRFGRLGRRGEFHALRDYREGDDPRDIYWRKSAHIGRQLIRQNEDPVGQQVALFLDNCQRQELLAPEDIDRQEEAITRVASLATHFIGRGYAVALVSRTVGVKADEGSPQLDRILRALALIDFINDERPYVASDRWAGDCIYVRPGGATTRKPPRAA